MKSIAKTPCAIALLLAATGAFAQGDAVRGKALYEKRCAACHSIDFNGVGPLIAAYTAARPATGQITTIRRR